MGEKLKAAIQRWRQHRKQREVTKSVGHYELTSWTRNYGRRTTTGGGDRASEPDNQTSSDSDAQAERARYVLDGAGPQPRVPGTHG